MGKKGKKSAKASKVSTTGKKLAADCVVPDLIYLGPASAASNPAFLQSEGITHVLSIGRSPPSKCDIKITTPTGPKQLQYFRLSLEDTTSSSLSSTVDRACGIIEAAEKVKGKVLVHCAAGISRSPAIVAAYLMKKKGMTLREALVVIVEAREGASPNEGFLKQLVELELSIHGTTTFEAKDGRLKLSTYLLKAEETVSVTVEVEEEKPTE